MIKLVQIVKNSYSEYELHSVYLNPSHIVFMSEDSSMKRQLTEGRINLPLDKHAEFTVIKLNEDSRLSTMTVIGSPDLIETKISTKIKKQLLRG